MLFLGVAAWGFDAGRSTVAFGAGDRGPLVEGLQLRVAAQEEEIARLRSLLMAGESSLQIERSAQKSLTDKNNVLLEENAKLKEDIAVFEKLTRLDGKVSDNVTLDRLVISPDGHSGRFRFSFTLALQGQKRGRESKFGLQLIVTPRAGAKIILPRRDDPDVVQYQVTVRNFRRVEGKFEIPAATPVESVEIQVLEAGVLKASKILAL